MGYVGVLEPHLPSGDGHPERPWRWVLVLFASQFLAMCLRNGKLGNLWFLGMVLFAFMSLPGLFAARVASRFSGGASNSAGTR